MLNKKLLLVEDETVTSMCTTEILKKNGFRVVPVNSGEKSVAVIDKEPDIDLILMDIDLGKGIDGTEAAVKILEKRNVPIVFLTNHGEKEFVDKVKGITRYGYVLKNSGEFVLTEAINMAFELYEANQKVLSEKQKLAQSEAELSAIYEHIPVLMLLLDKERKIRKTNAFAKNFLGTQAEMMMGKRVGEVLKCLNHLDHPKGCENSAACRECQLRRMVAETLQHGKNYFKAHTTLPFLNKGEDKQTAFLVSTTFIKLGIEPFVMVVIEDFTDIKSLEVELKMSKELNTTLMKKLHSDLEGPIVDT